MDPAKNWLTGLLPAAILVAIALAFPVCRLLLNRYRAAVLRGMSTIRSRGPQSESSQPAFIVTPPRALEIATVDAATLFPTAVDPIAMRAEAGPWRSALVYAIAGSAYAATMTAAWLLATGDAQVGWNKIILLLWSYLWPVLIAAVLIAGYDRKRQWQLGAAYFLVFAVIVVVTMVRNPALKAIELPVFWLLTNAPPTVLLLVFLARPIRAIGPLVVAFLLIVALGSQSIIAVVSLDDRYVRTAATLGDNLGLSASAIFYGMMLAGLLMFALLGYPLLRWLGRRYERKRFSAQSLIVDSVFLLYAVVQSIGLVFEGPAWILSGLVAFAAYKAVTLLAFRLQRRGSSETQTKTLLLLRVFALGKRSEQLFDKLRKHWQHIGDVAMIAGPDLVTTTIEPHELMAFIGGGLRDQFVVNESDLRRRLASIDRTRDPDGRFRINEIFLPRGHLANDDARADAFERGGPDGFAQLLALEPWLRIRNRTPAR